MRALLLLCVCACGPATGTAKLKFAISESARQSSALTSPLVGTFYGDIFLQEDVTVLGPSDAAVGYGSIKVDLDLQGLTNETPGAASVVTPKLAPGNYVVLGFLDVNGNADGDPRPDKGDPVTLALTNKFLIEAGRESARTVLFELVFN